MFDTLAQEIEELEIPPDPDAVAAASRLLDRLSARVHTAVGELDRSRRWEDDGSASLAAWLREHGGMSNRDARRQARTAAKLAGWQATRTAWEDGTLTGGQVEVIAAHVSARARALWAEHEAEVIPLLTGLNQIDTATAMREWARRAEAELDDSDPTEPQPQPRRTARLSELLDGRGVLDADLDPEGVELARKAISLAMRDDDEDEHRTPAERRGDALVDIFRAFCNEQAVATGGRHRPHLNVIIDHDDLVAGGPGRFFDDTPVDAVTMARLACDAAIHRIFTRGRSAVLDYGSATRVVSPALFTSLVIRDHRCRFPGCDRSVRFCDAHHVRFWTDGGPTRLDNLVLLCWHHHHRLHEAGWHAKLLPEGTFEVTLPDGRTRTSDPPAPPRARGPSRAPE